LGYPKSFALSVFRDFAKERKAAVALVLECVELRPIDVVEFIQYNGFAWRAFKNTVHTYERNYKHQLDLFRTNLHTDPKYLTLEKYIVESQRTKRNLLSNPHLDTNNCSNYPDTAEKKTKVAE
jgi:hypothetical protein